MKPICLAVLLQLCGMMTYAQFTYQNLAISTDLTAAEIKKYTYNNLRLYPIRAKHSFGSARHQGNYTSLKDALAKRMLVISEVDKGGTVNKLLVENISKDTIIIICGEVISGGKQDRIISTDLVLAPRSGKKDISVFCVEASRWSNQSTGSDKFYGYHDAAAMSLRKTVELKSKQEEVWIKVDDLNENAKTSKANKTKTYTAITTSPSHVSNTKKYRDHFMPLFEKEKDVIGVVVVSGNKVLGADIFASEQLFRNSFPSLLESYITEAILSGSPVTISSQVVKKYTDELLGSEPKQAEMLKTKGKQFIHNGKKLRITTYD